VDISTTSPGASPSPGPLQNHSPEPSGQQSPHHSQLSVHHTIVRCCHFIAPSIPVLLSRSLRLQQQQPAQQQQLYGAWGGATGQAPSRHVIPTSSSSKVSDILQYLECHACQSRKGWIKAHCIWMKAHTMGTAPIGKERGGEKRNSVPFLDSN